MEQDLREMFSKDRANARAMKEGHEKRFLEKLDKALPQSRKKPFGWLKIAVAITVLFALGLLLDQWPTDGGPEGTTITNAHGPSKVTDFSMGDLSPGLKKVEEYYVTNINMELANLELSEGTKDLVDKYMERLAELSAEYQKLTKELIEFGSNDQTISALIENLQLRLKLLHKLKKKLNALKTSKNEQLTENSI